MTHPIQKPTCTKSCVVMLDSEEWKISGEWMGETKNRISQVTCNWPDFSKWATTACFQDKNVTLVTFKGISVVAFQWQFRSLTRFSKQSDRHIGISASSFGTTCHCDHFILCRTYRILSDSTVDWVRTWRRQPYLFWRTVWRRVHERSGSHHDVEKASCDRQTPMTFLCLSCKLSSQFLCVPRTSPELVLSHHAEDKHKMQN